MSNNVLNAAEVGKNSGGFEFNGSTVGQIVLIIFLLLLSAFFAMSETALTRMSRIRASSLVDDERRGAQALHKLVDKPENWLHPVLFFLLVCHLTIGFLVPRLLEAPFGTWGIFFGIVAEAVVVFVGTELVPKDYAVKHTDRAALLVAGPINLLTRTPVVRVIQRLLHGIANAIVNPDLFERNRLMLVSEPYLMMEGILQNHGAPSVKVARVQPLRFGEPMVVSHDFH